METKDSKNKFKKKRKKQPLLKPVQLSLTLISKNYKKNFLMFKVKYFQIRKKLIH